VIANNAISSLPFPVFKRSFKFISENCSTLVIIFFMGNKVCFAKYFPKIKFINKHIKKNETKQILINVIFDNLSISIAEVSI
jgi:hypothetical protein